MGDVFHIFPALSDALQDIPDLQVDWIVESSFAQIPTWHPAVQHVFPIELRKWRKAPFKNRHKIREFFAEINSQNYDLVIDAQGLLKSAWVMGKITTDKKAGFNWSSAREALASFWYNKKIAVDKNQHSIWRLRELFYKSLGYAEPKQENINYALATANWQKLTLDNGLAENEKYAVFLHGTTWETKYWPENYWLDLANRINELNIKVVLPWGNVAEKFRAEKVLTKVSKGGQVIIPNNMLSLNEMAQCLKYAEFVVAVDTGLSHVAAALDVKMVVLYRVTDPVKIGATGSKVKQLISPEASFYLKTFESEAQEKNSLVNIAPNDVINALEEFK
jgi:heptosyltransferase-1